MSTSIDDLMSFGEEPAGEDVRPSGSGRARLLLRTAAVTAAVVPCITIATTGACVRGWTRPTARKNNPSRAIA